MTWVKTSLVLVHLEIMLVSTQERCMVCAECTISKEISLDAPDGTLGVVGEVDAHFSPFGDSVNLGARYVYGLCQTYHRLRNHF